MDPRAIMEALQAPFDPADIEWRVGSTTGDKTKGLALAYVTNRAIQNRLDDVVGPFGWQNEFREWKEQSQLCGISIKFEGEWITKWDGADDSNQEATKGGLSDSMKRAAYQWGIGRYLYKLPQQWVEIEPRGKSFAIKKGCEPKLPQWALPKGVKTEDPPKEDDMTIAKKSAIKAKIEVHKDILDGPKFIAFVEGQLQCKFEDMGFPDLQKVAEALEGAIQKKLEKKGA